MRTAYTARMRSPFGLVGIRIEGDAVAEIAYLPHSARELAPQNRLAARACAEIERYLEDPDYAFTLPLAHVGTDFQRRVWTRIAAIRRGHTRSYGEIARALGSSARPGGPAGPTPSRSSFPAIGSWRPAASAASRTTGAGSISRSSGGRSHMRQRG